MPTVFSHALIGFASASILADSGTPARFWALSVACSALPDLDVIGFVFDVPYGHVFGHRGVFHSLFFAAVLGLLVVSVFFREVQFGSSRWCLLTLYFVLLTSSHGLLDALTTGGFGIALLSPFDNTRYQFPYAVFEAAPLDLAGLFTPWGARVMAKEFLWIWIPAGLVLLWFRDSIRRSLFS